MISKTQQNPNTVVDHDIKMPQNINEMPAKNLCFDKINCVNKTSQTLQMAANNNKNLVDHLNVIHENKNISDDLEMKTTDFQTETRLQLSFSVDRLLADKSFKSNQLHDTDGHDRLGEKCCAELNTSFACCSLPNCLVNTNASSAALCKGNSQQDNDDEMLISPAFTLMDFKSVIRPTPVRAMGNSSETVSPLTHFSSLPPTSLIRFHHAHLQQQQQNQVAQQNFTLSSLINPLCGLKPLQLNPQQMGLQNFSAASANRFNTKVNFDIPISRANNLACIAALRHHHHLAAASTSEAHSHHNFNKSTATATSANTAATNTSSSSSHANTSSGKRKRSWSRAVFSNLQRKGLEIQFQQQKYITKPDRRKLAARLNLTDAQVKVWFQNRRMKWRHTRENLKSGQEKSSDDTAAKDTLKVNSDSATSSDLPGYSSDGSSSFELSDGIEEDDDDEIDVVE